MNENIIESIKYVVVSFDMSQDDVAEAVGVSPKTVWNWFNNKNTMPLDKAVALADALNISFDELVGRKPEKPRGSALVAAIYDKLNQTGKDRLEEYSLMLINSAKFREE